MKKLLYMTIAALALLTSCGQKKSSAPVDPSKLIDDPYLSEKYSGEQSPVQKTWGALNCHDPKLFQDDDGTYYVYSTDAAIGDYGAKGLQIRRSKDLVHWDSLIDSAIQGNWDKEWLEWVGFKRPVKATSWAPTIIKQNGLYYLLHGIITENHLSGKPTAAIYLAVAKNPEGPFYPVSEAAQKDEDIGAIFKKLGASYKTSIIVRYSFYEYLYEDFKSENGQECYNTGLYNPQMDEEADSGSWLFGFGCIDPEFVMDAATGLPAKSQVNGRPAYMLTYGSWKGGIAMIHLDPLTLKPLDKDGNAMDKSCDKEKGAFGKVVAGGYGAAYEGAQILYNSELGYYYLFVSMGNLEREYRVGVGRSKAPEGPYLDASDKPMLLDGMASMQYHTIGSKIKGACQLEGKRPFRCPGGQSIMKAQDGKLYFACHTRTNFLPSYFFYLQVNELFFNEKDWPVLNQNEFYPGLERKEAFGLEELAGEYDAILTVRDNQGGRFKGFADKEEAMDVNLADANPTVSKKININKKGKVSGAYSGQIELGKFEKDGVQHVKMTIKDKKATKKSYEFYGYFMNAVDWTGESSEKFKTITFTCLDSAGSGEYFWGNKR